MTLATAVAFSLIVFAFLQPVVDSQRLVGWLIANNSISVIRYLDIQAYRRAAPDCTGLVDLSPLTDGGKYLVSIPKDPKTSTATDSGYQISQDANGRITVSAPGAEQGKTISAIDNTMSSGITNAA